MAQQKKMTQLEEKARTWLTDRGVTLDVWFHWVYELRIY